MLNIEERYAERSNAPLRYFAFVLAEGMSLPAGHSAPTGTKGPRWCP
jgi:hypothetical protein